MSNDQFREPEIADACAHLEHKRILVNDWVAIEGFVRPGDWIFLGIVWAYGSGAMAVVRLCGEMVCQLVHYSRLERMRFTDG